MHLKGCPLRCSWCDRPQVRKPKKELLYDAACCVECMVCFPECPVDAHELVNTLHLIDRHKCTGCMACVDACPTGALLSASRSMGAEAILGQCQKMLVLGGGEPLVQHDGVLELLQKAKAKGICTCIETTGAFYPSQIPAILPYTDMFVFRIMDTEPERFKKNTGAKLAYILDNLKKIDEAGGKTRLLCKLIPGVNTDGAHANAVAALFKTLKNCEGILIEPYNRGEPAKWRMLDLIPPNLPKADEAAVSSFVEMLNHTGVPVIR